MLTKSVRELVKGDIVKLPGGSVVVVRDRPVVDETKGFVFVACMIPGLRYAQVLKFDWRERFDTEKEC